MFKVVPISPLKVLLGEIDEAKEAISKLKEVSLEEILEAQSKQQTAKEEQDRLRAKAFKERGLTYSAETAYEDLYWGSRDIVCWIVMQNFFFTKTKLIFRNRIFFPFYKWFCRMNSFKLKRIALFCIE